MLDRLVVLLQVVLAELVLWRVVLLITVVMVAVELLIAIVLLLEAPRSWTWYSIAAEGHAGNAERGAVGPRRGALEAQLLL